MFQRYYLLMIKRLECLLNPKSIAIVGGEWADALNDQVGVLGYTGAVYRIGSDIAFEIISIEPE